MVFSSVIFLFLFLPVVLAVNFLLPFRFRNLFLLVASLLFYAWGESFYVLIMLGSITGNYVFGRWIENASSKSRKRRLITAAVALNLALLIAFKYANFIATNLDLVFAAAGLPTIDLRPIHLPIGISFFTFQAMSYVVDVYRGHVRAQRRLVDLALYIALFPQLIAGPIVRYIDVAKEIVSRRTSWADFATGVRIFIVGLGKKILIANIVAAQCDRIFAIPAADLPAGVAWIGLTCFFFQIYFDFSGYSDMAIGLGRLFGIELPKNFDSPYKAESPSDFWRRWHMTL
ncbi:MAG TPA: MBOAT family O-acyltransferase, partial [Kiritimatiellia bacterium]